VGLSGPAVSDRVERLEEAGVIEGFTVDVDQSQLRAGIPVFVQATVPAADVDDCKATIADADAVEHVFVTADGECWFYARAQVRQVREWLQGLLPDADGVDYDVTLVDDAEWTPSLEGTAFALTCAECGNTVDSEGSRPGSTARCTTSAVPPVRAGSEGGTTGSRRGSDLRSQRNESA